MPSSKFWIDFEQKSWILKKIYASCSAGKPWYGWVAGLKMKSYYQMYPFWWKLDQENPGLCSKKMDFI